MTHQVTKQSFGKNMDFKCKKSPYGFIWKLEVEFFVHGDLKIEGVGFFKTYSLVVSCKTISIILIVYFCLGFLKHVNYTMPSVYSFLGNSEHAYIELNHVFLQEVWVLQLKQLLYKFR